MNTTLKFHNILHIGLPNCIIYILEYVGVFVDSVNGIFNRGKMQPIFIY